MKSLTVNNPVKKEVIKEIDNILRIKFLYEYEYLNRATIAKILKLDIRYVREIIRKYNFDQILGDDFVSIPEHPEYFMNLKNNVIVSVGYGKLKITFNETTGYLTVGLNGKIHNLHKVIYCTHHREWINDRSIVVDHIDGVKLNNDISNLRKCSYSENLRNSKLSKRNTSSFKGVSFYNPLNKYSAKISIDGKLTHLGYFDDPIDAAKVYDKTARKYRGEYARTNKQLGLL